MLERRQLPNNLSPEFIISTLRNCAGSVLPANSISAFQAATNWPTANKAFYQLISVRQPTVITKAFWHNGSAVAGNMDVGIFDYRTLKKIWSAGATAQGTLNTAQTVTVTGGALILPGQYYLGMSSDTTTNHRVFQMAYAAAIRSSLGGLYEQTTAYPLPDPIAPVTCTAGFVRPLWGFFTQATSY